MITAIVLAGECASTINNKAGMTANNPAAPQATEDAVLNAIRSSPTMTNPHMSTME